MMEPVYEGGCHCGRVRYRAVGEPHAPHYCHCRMCQRVVGAPTVAWVNFPAEGFAFTVGAPVYYESSPGTRRGFCVTCGTSLSAEDEDDAFVCITIASLDDPERVPPEYHVFTDSQLSWLKIDDGLPKRVE